MRSRHISTVISRTPAEVYAIASDPAQLPTWAAGLAAGPVRSVDGTLVVASPMGEVRVRFTPANDLGVLDHDVTLPDGSVTTNPLRVLPHPDGAEVVFTIRQLADEEAFENDAAAVAADLERLRALAEGAEPGVAPPGRTPARGAASQIRVATPDDARSLGELLYAFNSEFDAKTPTADEAAARFETLLSRVDVLAIVARLVDPDPADRAVGTARGTTERDPGIDVGFALLTLRPTPLWDGPLAQLEELYVRPDLRSGGIGTALLTRAMEECRDRGSLEMLINVDSDDRDTRRFYERHGFSHRDPDSDSPMLCYLQELRFDTSARVRGGP